MKTSPYRSKTKKTELARSEQLLIQTIAKIDKSALGISIGIVLGAGIFLATNILILKGGRQIGQTFALLNNFFFGFSVTFGGSFIGLIYGFISGFILGWLIALIRNFVIKIYLHIAKFRNRLIAVNKFIDF